MPDTDESGEAERMGHESNAALASAGRREVQPENLAPSPARL